MKVPASWVPPEASSWLENCCLLTVLPLPFLPITLGIKSSTYEAGVGAHRHSIHNRKKKRQRERERKRKEKRKEGRKRKGKEGRKEERQRKKHQTALRAMETVKIQPWNVTGELC